MTNNYYKDLYLKYQKSEFKGKLAQLKIADEMNDVFAIDNIKDADFETLCNFTYEMWLDNERLAIQDIVWAIYDYLEKENLEIYRNSHDIKDLKEWLEINYNDIRKDACYYGAY